MYSLPTSMRKAQMRLTITRSFCVSATTMAGRRPPILSDWQLLAEFAPDVIVAAGWHIRGYRKVLRSFAGKVPRILWMDNQWRGTFKQHLAVVTRKVFFAKLCDAAWVPGERQVMFVNRLGFTAGRVLQGMYTAEVDRFAPA